MNEKDRRLFLLLESLRTHNGTGSDVTFEVLYDVNATHNRKSFILGLKRPFRGSTMNWSEFSNFNQTTPYMGKHSDFLLSYFQIVGEWPYFTVITKLQMFLRVNMVLGDALKKLETFA